ncbi:MAG TPA: hypothetical protein VID24_12955 [Candidatus Eremiobacteraceae bacterium]
MFAAFLAAGLLLDSTASSSSSQAQASAPLREIVYNFSDDESVEYTTDQAPNDPFTSSGSVSTPTTGLAAPPESQTRASGFHGTMTVDVLEVDSTGFLKAEVKEITTAENGKQPFDATFIVRPDGEVVKVSGSDDADMTSLMRYFGTSYFADRSLVEGQQWSTDMTYGTTEFQTSTAVTGTSGDDVTIKSTSKAVKGIGNGSLTIETSLVYNAPKLVPVKLDVVQIRAGSGDTASAEQVSRYHFVRVSDSLDKG